MMRVVKTGKAKCFLQVIFVLLIFIGLSSFVSANVNLEFRPIEQSAYVHDTLEIGLYAVSDNNEEQSIGAIDFIFEWDNEFMRLAGLNHAGEPDWSTSAFMPDPYWINEEIPPQDGTGIYTGWGKPYPSMIRVTPEGTLLTTFKFEILKETSNWGFAVQLRMLATEVTYPCPGNQCPMGRTKVYDGVVPNKDVTGTLGTGAKIEVIEGEGTCGNGQLEPGEQCDGSNLNQQTCELQGYPAGGQLKCSNECKFDFSACSILPSYSKFNGETTNFGQEPNIKSVEGAVLEIQSHGKINFENQVQDYERLDLDTSVEIKENYVSILTSGGRMENLNAPAVLTFYNVDFENPGIFHIGVEGGQDIECQDCTFISYEEGNYKAKVTGFPVFQGFNVYALKEKGGGQQQQPECTTNDECIDELFCNGVETCVEGFCQQGANPCISGKVCDEEGNQCVDESSIECGNGECEAGESYVACPWDCKQSPQPEQPEQEQPEQEQSEPEQEQPEQPEQPEQEQPEQEQEQPEQPGQNQNPNVNQAGQEAQNESIFTVIIGFFTNIFRSIFGT